MAEHKAPTQVSIAPLAERSAFEQAVTKYWKPAAAIALAVATYVVVTEVTAEQELAEMDGSWNDLGSAVELSSLSFGSELPKPEALSPVVQQLENTIAGPWAMALEAEAQVQAGDFDQAEATLASLRSTYPDHPLVSRRLQLEEGVEILVVDRMKERAGKLASRSEAWSAMEGPPALPTGAPRVRLVTSRGVITVGLYTDRAPKHAENFLKLCREGYYDGTKFHRVLKDQIIQGGDPNTREDELGTTWGLGGPEYTIAPEITDAWHFSGMLAAAKKGGAVESSGSQFYLTASPTHQFDKQYTVFGRVLEGLDLVERLAQEVPEQSDRPESPVTLEGTEIL